MNTERLVQAALENSVKDLSCPEPDIEQLLAVGRAMRRRRVVMVASLAAAAVLVLVLAGLSFVWAGSSGRAQEPVPANPTTSASIGSAFTSPMQKWIDALPAGAPPSTPYWHDGVLYVNGAQIAARYAALDITVAGDTVLVGGYQSEPKEGTTPTAWALVRGDRLEPLPVPPGGHPPGLSVDGRIAYWVRHQETSNTPQFFTWDTKTNSPLATHTPQGDGPWDGVELLGVDAAGSGYWKTSLSDDYLTRWDIRTNTLHPTGLAYDTMQGPETFDGVMPWMHPGEKYRSPDGTKVVFTDSIPSDSPSDCCVDQLRVGPVAPSKSLDPKDVITLPLPKPDPAARFSLGDGEGDEWVWWESDESVLVSVDGDRRPYLVRCSSTGGACQRVAALGAFTPRTDGVRPDWSRNWGFALAPLSH